MRRFLNLIITCILIAAALAFYVSHQRIGPDHATVVEIPLGSTFAEAAQHLEDSHVAPAILLRLVARVTGQEAKLHAGALIFPAHETIPEIIDHLTVHSRQASVWVSIPEGYTAVQIEQRLKAARLPGGHGFAAYSHKARAILGTESTASLEGYLFPDTYLINRDATTTDIAQMMLTEFRQHLPPNAEAQAHHLGYRLTQVMTIASLIEREAQVEAERPIMAGLYYHRLAIGMPLQVDAGLEYTLPYHETVIRGADLRHDTPYNTYLHQGLPPTPIANPGLPAILAALHPVRTHYLYYVYKGGGRHAFAETYEDHQANIARYLR